jgi:hypothetical protein
MVSSRSGVTSNSTNIPSTVAVIIRNSCITFRNGLMVTDKVQACISRADNSNAYRSSFLTFLTWTPYVELFPPLKTSSSKYRPNRKPFFKWFSGVRRRSLHTVTNILSYQNLLRMLYDYGALNGMRSGRANRSNRRKPTPTVTFSTTNPIWSDLGKNPGYSSKNRELWHGPTVSQFYTRIYHAGLHTAIKNRSKNTMFRKTNSLKTVFVSYATGVYGGPT